MMTKKILSVWMSNSEYINISIECYRRLEDAIKNNDRDLIEYLLNKIDCYYYMLLKNSDLLDI